MLVCAESIESSERLAPTALGWAAELGLEMAVAAVMHPWDVESADPPERLLGPLIAPFGHPDRVSTTVLTNTYVAGALADYADDLPAAMIEMNCHGRTGLARIVLGSVTMAVLHLATCPLLVTHDTR